VTRYFNLILFCLNAGVTGVFSQTSDFNPGFKIRNHCMANPKIIRSDSTKGFGFPHRLKIKINDQELVRDRDYQINSDSGLILFAFEPGELDKVCLEISESPFIREHRVQFFRFKGK